MLSDYPCPVCAADDWERVASHIYRRDALSPDRRGAAAARRTTVLHDLWFGGRDVIELTSRLCRRCGFAAYSPRPTEEALDAKYAFLLSEERPSTAAGGWAALPEAELRRGRRTHAATVSHLGRVPERVLDFGGMDGRLMLPFLDAGARCHMLDPFVQTLPGVERLGATLGDLPKGMTFDAIVCSHVLEHVADPRGVLDALAGRLTPDGVLYVEVPDEVWRSVPVWDAVTHVNFFTAGSLRALLGKVGLEIRSFAREPGSYGDQRKRVLIGVCTPAPAGKDSTPSGDERLGGADETRALLHPSLRARCARALGDLLRAKSLRRATP